MDNFNQGALWRRWDLHIHTPFTKLSNGYLGEGTEDEIWKSYIDFLENSPVQAFGITDYFSCDNYFKFVDKFKAQHNKSHKVFFPNIELRLSESISKENTNPDLHIIFDNDLSKCSQEKLGKFLGNLKTIAATDDGVRIACSELNSVKEYEAACPAPYLCTSLI